MQSALAPLKLCIFRSDCQHITTLEKRTVQKGLVEIKGGAVSRKQKLKIARVFTLTPPEHPTFSYSATCRTHLHRALQGDSSILPLLLNAQSPRGKESCPLKLHLGCYRHRPRPQSLKSQRTAYTWASRFLHSRAASWNFKGNPSNDSLGCC